MPARGRFYAANEINMLLAKLIAGYGFKTEEGTTERYADIKAGTFTTADSKKTLLYRKTTAA